MCHDPLPGPTIAGGSRFSRGDLTGIITTLLPHIVDNTCPVCQGDYSEISEESLADHLTLRIAELNSEAKRLQSILATMREASADERRLIARLTDLQQSQLSPEVRLEYRRRFLDLTQSERKLEAISARVDEGDTVIRAEVVTRMTLIDLRNNNSRIADIRRAVTQLCTTLEQPPVTDSESAEQAISRLTSYVEEHITTLAQRLAGQRELIGLKGDLEDRLLRADESRRAALATTAELARHTRAIEAFESIKNQAKSLRAAAEASRSRVVREVFNHSLNRIWRDLFVRLVPSEPFVPAFHIVTGPAGAAVAELETHHRDGGTGGNPSFMLSAGNLNTGAVTLFLALHLSVQPKLPWLILDDPVQSMDEVHIAQFAALLQTLVKQEGRKLIIAVHERSLFNYLSLELSPSFEGDRLVTVELSRPDGGITVIDPRFVGWNDDRALAAV